MTKSDKRDPMEPFDDISRRHVMTGTSALVLVGVASQAFPQPSDGSKTMAGNVRFSSPDTMQKPPGYSHVVEVTGPGRTIYFAGQLGIDKSGKMGSDAREQMEIAFQNVKAALDSGARHFPTLSRSTATSSISVPISLITAKYGTRTSTCPRHRQVQRLVCRSWLGQAPFSKSKQL